MILNLEVVGQGQTTKIYRDGDVALKLYENAPVDEVSNEAKRQEFAFKAGLPVPEVFGVRKYSDNAIALCMEYIDGLPILQRGMNKDDRNAAIHTLVKLQCDIQKIDAHGEPRQVRRIAWKIKNSELIDGFIKNELLLLLARLDDNSFNLCHGDMHPLNVLYDGNKYWVIDWVDAACGNPLADACRSYLIFKQYISRCAGIYLRLYCKESGVKQEDVLAWLPIIAAARLDENIDDKTKTWLLSLIKEVCLI
jgi:aminoglycoside phosphotransferase (APT) family kinase protein